MRCPFSQNHKVQTSLDQRLPALSLVEILACLPVASQPRMKSTSRVFKDIMESERCVQTRRSHPIEVVVVKPKTGKGLAKVASRLVDAFMKSDSESTLPLVESIRVEWEKAEFYKFLQLRVGGEQAPPRPFEQDLYINGLDPKGAGRLRKAWWASVRSVLDGLPIPLSARVLLLGERRLGGRSSYSWAMALVWTGQDYGVLKCHLDAAYLDCTMICSGGIKEQYVKAALGVLLRKSQRMKTFNEFAEAFESALNDMMEHKKWEEDWSYPPMGEGDDDEDDLDTFYEEETMESYFQAFEKPDLGTWCFGK